ncbi:hypothetical protein ACQ33O_03910 [Ferruginibacter sp. SUN002]|uniref:hypothetical protein n=1 Tax=Ferruginibacter sp. SUN002 TaxID=2937789 RepID=UPI003D366486
MNSTEKKIPISSLPPSLLKMLEGFPPAIKSKILEGLITAATKKIGERKLAKLIEENKLNNDIMDTEWGKIIINKQPQALEKKITKDDLERDGQILYDLIKTYKKTLYRNLKKSGTLFFEIREAELQYQKDKKELVEAGHNDSTAREILWPEVVAQFGF